MNRIISPLEILETAAGFQKSQTVFAFAELEIPDLLKTGPKNAADLAATVRIHPLAMRRFLDACVTLGLLDKAGGFYSNSPISAEYLIKDKTFYLGGQLRRYRTRSFPQWEDLTEKLRAWDYGDDKQENPESDDQGAEAMREQHNLALLHGCALARSFDFGRYRRILDLGGGTGATSIALCQSYPQLRSVVYDLPENAAIARDFVEENGLGDRIATTGGDFRQDPLPDDFDCVVLANFMAVADAPENQKLLAKIHDRLPDGGCCLLSGWIVDDDGLAPQLSVLFSLEDVCWNAPDVERSESVYRGWLEKAGFTGIECRTYLEPTKMMYGFRISDFGFRISDCSK
ncbi:MAG: methyltransferase domain-containing protein [Acidobacteria bacterium]|nr:methyltransferase domain-containing protein [Acidobacteriota bacterium]